MLKIHKIVFEQKRESAPEKNISHSCANNTKKTCLLRTILSFWRFLRERREQKSRTGGRKKEKQETESEIFSKTFYHRFDGERGRRKKRGEAQKHFSLARHYFATCETLTPVYLYGGEI